MNIKYNEKQLLALAFYGLLTFLISPIVSNHLFKESKDAEMIGFFLGFIVSVFLWEYYGKKLKK